MNKKKIAIIASLSTLAVVTTLAITLPIILNNKEDFKDDGTIEIWTTSSEKDQFFNSFKSNFVDEFNKDSEYKVELVTVTPQESLAADIGIKMNAKSEVPNLFIGKGQDSIYLSKFENEFVSLLDIDEYTDSLVLDNYSWYYDEFQNKNIKPYAALMINGESLFMNKLQFQSFIDFAIKNSIIDVSEQFKELFEYSSDSEYNEYYDDKKIEGNTIIEDFYTKYGGSLDIDIFDSWEGIVDLSRVMNSLFIDTSNYSIGIDRDVSAAQYLTFNAVGNSYDNWMFNSENDLNFIDSLDAQQAYSNFVDSYHFLIDEGDMWVRENDNTNPTGPFVNDELTMFVGANFNAKYINSEEENKIQYNESVIIEPPTKLLDSSIETFVFTKPKTINGLSFGTDEDKVAGEFVDFVLTGLNQDYSFFINEGYLPPVTDKQSFIEFYDYINDDNNFTDVSDKERSLINSLRATASAIMDSFDNPNMVIFDVPQLETTTLFEELLFEANRIESGDQAVEYLINQLEVNT